MNRLNKVLITCLFTVVCFSGCKASYFWQAWNYIIPESYFEHNAIAGAHNLILHLANKAQSPSQKDKNKKEINENLSVFCENVACSIKPNLLSKTAIYSGIIKNLIPIHFWGACSEKDLNKVKESLAKGPGKVHEETAPEFVNKTIFDNFVYCVKIKPNDPKRLEKCTEAFGNKGISGMFGQDYAEKMEARFKEFGENEL